MYVRRRPVGVNGATLVECPRRCVEAGRFRMGGRHAAFGEPPEPLADELPGKAFAARRAPTGSKWPARATISDQQMQQARKRPGLVSSTTRSRDSSYKARGPQRLVVLKRPRVSMDGDPFSKERIRGVAKAVRRGQLRRR